MHCVVFASVRELGQRSWHASSLSAELQLALIHGSAARPVSACLIYAWYKSHRLAGEPAWWGRVGGGRFDQINHSPVHLQHCTPRLTSGLKRFQIPRWRYLRPRNCLAKAHCTVLTNPSAGSEQISPGSARRVVGLNWYRWPTHLCEPHAWLLDLLFALVLLILLIYSTCGLLGTK